MKKAYLSLFLFVSLFTNVQLRADEGMWLPILLDQLNITDMQARGFKLSAADIYNVNNTSMKDAVCQFGGGCTAELISGEGLLLTNHHCGIGYVQSHSSVEHDYLSNGFWAMNREEELPCPGLTATFIISMEDVTTQVLKNIDDQLGEKERNDAILKNIKELEKKNSVNGYEATIRSFYYGNVFYMFITETFTDVRLVGAPPISIGNYGGDTDNWVWPRHTGDFSMFRIYAGKDNRAAKYSKDNVPYKPKHFFSINAKGVKENDFTLVYGFPGRTTEYLTSYGVELVANVSDPLKVDLRTQRINIMEEEMKKSDKVRIQYTAKRNGTANAWKKWQGEMKGIRENDVVRKKQLQEADFMKRVQADNTLNNKYGTLLSDMDKAHQDLTPWQKGIDYMNEGCFSVEIIRFAGSFRKLIELCQAPTPNQKEIDDQLMALKASLPGFYKDYDINVDRKTAVALFSSVDKGMDPSMKPSVFADINKKYKGDIAKYFETVFGKSIFTNQEKLTALLSNWKNADWKKISKDPMFSLAAGLYNHQSTLIVPEWSKRNNEVNRLQRIYMKAQMEVFKDKKFYPDANSTLRVAFGNVDDYTPRDGVTYNWFTTLDGVIEKEDTTNPEFYVPTKLKYLYQTKDYGKYADKTDGHIHTCFIASNHTTGGNSGSPVLDAQGNLIGTNFDRCWEGTMSDINYDKDVCRNIVLDVRYTLFIIDKFAGAGYLLNEMKIIW
ncbi:MAG: S46 family peptidase [Bacteroidia bacterium]